MKFAGSAVETNPSTRSLPELVVALPLPGDELVPCVPTDTSRELLEATPAYSKIANRMVAEIVSDSDTVFAPPETFSA